MFYRIKFYARMRDEIIERTIEADNKESAIFCLTHYYGSYNEDVIEVKEA